MHVFSVYWLWNGLQFEPATGFPFSDRGARYGMSIFETLRLRRGLPECLGAHLERLCQAAQTCGFHLPEGALEAVTTLFPIGARDGMARLYVTAGDGGPSDPAARCRMALFFEERACVVPASYSVILETEPHLPLFGGLKTANYWRNAESLRRARNGGAHEALLFDPAGILIGACMANVFLKTAGQWVTPSPACGARTGVVRAWAMATLGAKEARFKAEELQQADSVFLTSSWLGVMPVDRIGAQKLPPPPEEVLNLRAEWDETPK
ncbi:MAG: branched-chain amino acid aminotransferase [Verrucomicrobia bacterium]|nr:MAG: branched-chain amino acid aminotransferase [Verrucomicrobiota bacterium]